MSKKVAFHTLGCRLNFSETGHLAHEFTKRGYQISSFGDEVDVTFINTCTVTDGADSTCRNAIRKAQKASPEGKVVVAGCYAQMEPEKLKEMKGIDLILGTSEKHKVFDYLDHEEDIQVKIDQTNEFWGAYTTKSDTHTRAFLKIQDGCNYICSFCIIPFARGRSRTISIKEAIHNAQSILEQGHKEIVLTGVNIGEYESSSGEKLSQLLFELEKLEGLERIRLSSVEPNTFNDELLNVMKNSKKFLPHFHIPLQSADNQILKKMRRKYTVEEYSNVLANIQEIYPDACFGADIIVGHPGETEDCFQATYDFLKHSPITHFHVFPYSKRKNTTAAKMNDHVHQMVKKERVKKLMQLGDEKLLAVTLEQIGKKSNVLFETEADGYVSGLTENFLRVSVPYFEGFKNSIKLVEITHFDEDKKKLQGRISKC